MISGLQRETRYVRERAHLSLQSQLKAFGYEKRIYKQTSVQSRGFEEWESVRRWKIGLFILAYVLRLLSHSFSPVPLNR